MTTPQMPLDIINPLEPIPTLLIVLPISHFLLIHVLQLETRRDGLDRREGAGELARREGSRGGGVVGAGDEVEEGWLLGRTDGGRSWVDSGEEELGEERREDGVLECDVVLQCAGLGRALGTKRAPERKGRTDLYFFLQPSS